MVDFWISGIKKGSKINIIPFEYAVQKIISEELVIDLRANDLCTIKREARAPCGCGGKLVVIDLDGKCYACDTLIGREDAIIGDIWDGVDPRKYLENNDFFVYGEFKGCPRRTVKSNDKIAYTKETIGCPAISGNKPDFYCQAAGGFLERIMNNMKDVLNYNGADFFSPISDFTEQLP